MWTQTRGSGSEHKDKLYYAPLQECRQGAHLPSFDHEPVGGYTTKFVTHGHCDVRHIRLPSQLQRITTLWPVPNYTAL